MSAMRIAVLATMPRRDSAAADERGNGFRFAPKVLARVGSNSIMSLPYRGDIAIGVGARSIL
jgi:hypothetical protein